MGQINVINPAGNLVSIPEENLQDALSSNLYRLPTEQEAAPSQQSSDFLGSLGAAAQGAAETATLGFAPAFEKTAGIASPEDLLKLRQEHPTAHLVGNIAGLFNPSGAEEAISEAGMNLANAMGLGAEGAGFASRLAAKGVQGGVEAGAFQARDEIARMLEHDPNQSAETALQDIGLAGLLGGGLNAGFGVVSPLWDATVGSKVGQFIEDAKGVIKKNITTPDLGQALREEMEPYYKGMSDAASDVYGPTGLKAQEIEKLAPEMSEKISTQAQDLINSLGQKVEMMRKDGDVYPTRLVNKLEKNLNDLRDTVSNADSTADVFQAIDKTKRQLQSYVPYGKPMLSIEPEYDFVQGVRGMASDFRNALEDSDVWGKIGERNKAINEAFKEYSPALKDFEKKFTSPLGQERVINPDAMAKYANALGKPSAELRQDMLENFINASEKYKKVIDQTHANLGLESPFQPSSLAVSKGTLQQVTPGMKFGQALVNRGLANLTGHGIGTAIGAGVGMLLGHPAIGAVVGERAIGPFAESILPSIMKPVMAKTANALGFKHALEYGVAVAKGESLMSKAAKNVFQTAKTVLPSAAVPSPKAIAKLNDHLEEFQTNPEKMLNIGGQTAHYLPEHGTALASVAGRAVSTLNSLRPSQDAKAPLDIPNAPSKAQQAEFQKALTLANQPLVAIQHMKAGTLTSKDVMLLKQLYPNWYSRMSQKLSNELIEKVNKGENVPYALRQQISLFLGQPMDSTFTPQSIQSTQPQVPTQPQVNQQQPQPRKSQMTAMAKMPSLMATPSQAREMQRVIK